MSGRRKQLVSACNHHLVLAEPHRFLCSMVGHKLKSCNCGEQRMCIRCDARYRALAE